MGALLGLAVVVPVGRDPPRVTLFPYTTLFRAAVGERRAVVEVAGRRPGVVDRSRVADRFRVEIDVTGDRDSACLGSGELSAASAGACAPCLGRAGQADRRRAVESPF